MTALQLDLDEGLRRRNVGLDSVEAHEASWLAEARKVARYIAWERGTVTSDDVQLHCRRPAGVTPNAVGGIFRGKEWVFVDYTRSARPETHGRRIGVWALAEDMASELQRQEGGCLSEIPPSQEESAKKSEAPRSFGEEPGRLPQPMR
jgi:hypothetical protein